MLCARIAQIALAAAILVVTMAGFVHAEPAMEPDAVFFNGKIATLDAAGSMVSGVAVKDGKIIAVGSSDAMKKLAKPSTKLVDLGGKTVLPGLIDAHCHPMETIMMKDGWVDARYPACPSVKQALENIATWIERMPKGKWVFVACVSASENKFVEKRLPTKAELDKVAPDNPVAVADGTHLAVVNSLALNLLRVTKGVSTLKGGGRAILDKDGEHRSPVLAAVWPGRHSDSRKAGRL
jgi:predicted amidohydrolase YtcJ